VHPQQVHIDHAKLSGAVDTAEGWDAMETSLEAFKVRLDGALSNLILLKMSVLIAGPLKVTCNPNDCTILPCRSLENID